MKLDDYVPPVDPASLRRIGVLRALMLGDLLCALPALRAMAGACPQAKITLIGLPWARELAQRLPYVHRFVEFPGWPGLPEREVDLAALPPFLQTMQQQHFDLLVQLHGSGRIVNPLLAACGAARCAGFHPRGENAAGATDARLFIPWPEHGHEIERLLALTDHLGFARRGVELEFPVIEADRRALAELWPDAARGVPYVCIHAGAQLASRRWLPERFARVAERLAERGYAVVLTGSGAESAIADRIAGLTRAPLVDLTGATSLWTLGALIERAALLVCNDTGVSHIAAALRTPSVVISCGSDVARWAPLDRALHPVLWQPIECRPCMHTHCPAERGHACAHAISAETVTAAALRRAAPVAAEVTG